MRCARSGVGLRSSRQGERDAQAQTPALIRDLESRRLGGSPGSREFLEKLPRAAERANPGGLEGRTILSSVVREVRLARADVEKYRVILASASTSACGPQRRSPSSLMQMLAGGPF